MNKIISILSIWLFSNSSIAQEKPAYTPPLLGQIQYGELMVKVERKFLLNSIRFQYDVHLFFSPQLPSGMRYMVRSEGINNKGIFFSIRRDDSVYWIDDNQHTISAKVKKLENNQPEWEDFFSQWLLLPKEKQAVQASSLLRDTLISGIHFRYFVTTSSVEIPDNNSSKTVINFYYLDPQDLNIKRNERYNLVENDTDIVISDLLYVKPHSAEEFTKFCTDTVQRYLNEFTLKKNISETKKETANINSLLGASLPEMTFSTKGGKNFTVNEIPSTCVLLDFSYNACMPCHHAIPILKRIEQEYSAKGIKVIGADYADNFSEIEYNIQKNNINYPIYPVKKDDLIKMGIQGYPTFILLDSNRVVRYIRDGYGEDLYVELSKNIESLLAKK